MKRPISRRQVLKGGGVAALATLTGCRVSADSVSGDVLPISTAAPTALPPPTAIPTPSASPLPEPTPTAATTPQPSVGTAVRVVSNARDDIPQRALVDSIDGFDGPEPDIEFIDTFNYQDRIDSLLAEDYDVLAWFSGFRNRQFAEQGLVLDLSDVWERSPRLMSGARAVSTSDDGRQYFVPISFYTWAINYSMPVFETNDWDPPTSFDELLSLADDMATRGVTPFAMANDGNWPAMGTFDMLNLRVNGYQFHRDVLAGRESFVDGRVKDVFTQWEQLLPYQQAGANSRTWQEAAFDLAEGRVGMYLMGTFVTSAESQLEEDMDFFNFPEIDPAIGAGAIDAPIDGYMLSAQSPSPDDARELLTYLASGASQQAAATIDQATLYTNLDVRPSRPADRIKRRSQELAAQSEVMASFLDRETTPQFAQACGDVLQEFLDDPTSIDAGLDQLEELSSEIL